MSDNDTQRREAFEASVQNSPDRVRRRELCESVRAGAVAALVAAGGTIKNAAVVVVGGVSVYVDVNPISLSSRSGREGTLSVRVGGRDFKAWGFGRNGRKDFAAVLEFVEREACIVRAHEQKEREQKEREQKAADAVSAARLRIAIPPGVKLTALKTGEVAVVFTVGADRIEAVLAVLAPVMTEPGR